MAENGKICIIFSDIKNDFNDGYVLGIQKQANAYGYRTYTFSMPQLSELYTNEEDFVFELIDFDIYDGVIFSERSFAAHRNLILPIEEAIKKKCHCPVVVIGASENFSNVVRVYNQSKYEQIAEHLIEVHGCKKIYCLGGDKNIADERIDGFRNVMKQHGLPCNDENVLYGGYWIQGAEALAKDISYDVVAKPDAVMCLNDEIAYALIKNLYKFGIRVPEDILVTGYDASHYAENDAVSITTVRADTMECGRRAVALLESLIHGGEPEEIPARQQPLVTGMSCGCGENRKFNVRVRLDELQKAETANMEFRNSCLEEKLYKIQSLTDFSLFIKNHKYLIRDQISVGVNLMNRGDEVANCVYLKDYLINGETMLFPAKEIHPPVFAYGAIKNIHVLPLCFDKKIYGYMTMGYAEENVFTSLAKQFAKHLAIGLEILSIRGNLDVMSESASVSEDEMRDSISHFDKNAAVIFIMHEGLMHKVQLGQVMYFESANKKVFATLKNGKFEIKQRLFEVENMVIGRKFLRISKSVIVNLERIVGYKADGDRTLTVMLENKETLRVSRNFCDEFRMSLEKN